MTYTITTEMPLIDLNSLQPATATSERLANQIIEVVLSGTINPLDLPVKKKCIEQAFDIAAKDYKVKEAIQEELQKWNGKANHLGAKVEKMEAGIKYIFDACNDPLLQQLEKELYAASELVKQRKDFLKRVPAAGETILHEDEVITIYPPQKESTTTWKTTFL